MINYKKIAFIFSFCIFFVSQIQGQRSTEAKTLLDSLNNTVNYDMNPHIVIKISKDLLSIGEKEKDTFLILRALHHLGRRNQFLNENHKSIAYFERELSFFSKNLISKKVKQELKSTEIDPVEIYAQLGNNFSTLGDKKTALDFYNKSKDIAEKENLEFYKAVMPILIASLKVSIKEYDEAIKNYKIGLKRLKAAKDIDKRTRDFNSSITITSLARTYLLKNDINSAKTTINKGIAEGYDKSNKDGEISFKIIEAEILKKEKKFNKALQLYKVIKKESDSLDKNKGILYYYNGYAECLAHLKKFKEAISLIEKGIKTQNTNDYSLSEEYKQLAQYYKALGDIKNSNIYFEKYVLSQTALEKNKREVVKKFHDKELENLASAKEKQQKYASFYIIGSSIFIALLILYLFKISKKRKVETQKFNELQKKVSTQKNNIIINTTEKEINEGKSTDINKETIEQILNGLQKIEEQEYYLKQECNLYNVAKKIKTNTSYLSKVVNAQFQKNFNTYINDLRINYTLIKLEKDTRFRSYSIKSIAEEIGYKSADSFSKYFKRRTGLLPSVYIKKLNKL